MLDNNLKWCREELELTQEEIGTILNVSRKTVSGWENANDPIPLLKLMTFCDKFNYSLDFAIGFTRKNQTSKLTKKIDINTISKNLKKMRKSMNLSQEQFAGNCGLSQTTYSHYETGHNLITTTNLYYICKTYNVSMDYMVGRTEIQKLK